MEVQLQGKYSEAIIYTSEQADQNNLEGTIGSVIEMLNTKALEGTKVRIMPDYHKGKGCVIGTTIVLKDKVVPSHVGVDIGCGVLAVELERKPTLDELKDLDENMATIVPSGSNIFEGKSLKGIQNIFKKENLQANNVTDENTANSLGTLGSGNHFIEIGHSEKDNKSYLFIHSGSRGFGARIANYHMKKAVTHMENLVLDELGMTPDKIISKYKKINKQLIETKLQEYHKERENILSKYGKVSKDNAYLSGELFEQYMEDLILAKQYATENRLVMAKSISKHLGIKSKVLCDSVHNYIEKIEEDGNTVYIVRKGATRADKNETLVIPMNMRDGVIIAKGKGNSEWNNSAPHGAGRIYSRRKAKDELDFSKFKDEMKDIYTTSVKNETLDESPMAYKPIEHIIDVVEDTIDILDIVKPIYNFKSDS